MEIEELFYKFTNKVGTQSTFCDTQNVTVIRVKRRKTCRIYSIRLDLMLLEKNKQVCFFLEPDVFQRNKRTSYKLDGVSRCMSFRTTPKDPYSK